jgi:dTDP-4-dehydrorhamnose 3,5-epimerase
MNIKETPINGLFIIQPKVFEDERGYFFESYSKKILKDNGLDLNFIQDNQSLSHKDVLRGMHFQAPPFDQGKLVRVVKGSVLDVAIDIRKKSPTYGQHFSIVLSEENKTMFWIPPGFAHGFLTLEDNTIFSYKCTGLYNKESEGSLLWNDKEINIDWNVENPIVSEKDQISTTFLELNSPF